MGIKIKIALCERSGTWRQNASTVPKRMASRVARLLQNSCRALFGSGNWNCDIYQTTSRSDERSRQEWSRGAQPHRVIHTLFMLWHLTCSDCVNDAEILYAVARRLFNEGAEKFRRAHVHSFRSVDSLFGAAIEQEKQALAMRAEAMENQKQANRICRTHATISEAKV